MSCGGARKCNAVVLARRSIYWIVRRIEGIYSIYCDGEEDRRI
jgi:hypothetical protein